MSRMIYVNDLQKKYGEDLVIEFRTIGHTHQYRLYYVKYKGRVLVNWERTRLSIIDKLLDQEAHNQFIKESDYNQDLNKLENNLKNAQNQYTRFLNEPAPSGIEVVKVFFNKRKRTTTVLFEDGDRVIVKSSRLTKFDPYAGFTAAIAKRVFKTNSQVKRIVESGIKQ